MTDLTMNRVVRARKSHAAKTGLDTRAARSLIGAMFGAGPRFHEDEDGNVIREWQPADMQRYTNADLRLALSNRVALTDAEMLGTVPMSAIRYCVTRGYLRPHGTGGLYFVTETGAHDLKLPRRFRGGVHHGRKIKFQPAPRLASKAGYQAATKAVS
jgi:hypothetical protein